VFNDTCVTCNPGYAPTLDRSTCAKLRPEHLTWENPWAIVPLVFSGLGVVATIFTAFVFLRFHDTPIIMASGRELCYVLLAGILFCFLMSPVILAKPTVATCGFLRLGLGLCLSICP
jgi:metabotropic glutamate receptor 6/7/8